MNGIPQTNIQLYGQMLTAGYSDVEMDGVARAYDLAQRLFSAGFRGSGRPFLCHLVGTASILARDRAPATEVTVALLHAAYAAGEFPFDMHRAVSKRKRDWVRQAIGDEAEQLTLAYQEFAWNHAALVRLADGVSSRELALVRLRLANELDDLADDGLRFSGAAKRSLLDEPDNRRLLVSLAAQVGLPHLEADLIAALRRYESRSVDCSETWVPVAPAYSYVLLPGSARERFASRSAKLWKRIARKLRRLRAKS